jgi:hypothetical protein
MLFRASFAFNSGIGHCCPLRSISISAFISIAAFYQAMHAKYHE